MIRNLIDVFLHLDAHLLDLVTTHGVWVYGILFLVVFCETGLVVTPILPGDSLLFAAGTVAAMGALSPAVLVISLIVAAVAGDAVNYAIGRSLGDRAQSLRFIRQDHLRRTVEFYERHGGKTIVLARFVPIIRTFAPFAAGIGKMAYRRFAVYNVAGAMVWVVLFVLAGFIFGSVEWVKDNLTMVMLAIVAGSLLPAVFGAAKSRVRARRTDHVRYSPSCSNMEPTDASQPKQT